MNFSKKITEMQSISTERIDISEAERNGMFIQGVITLADEDLDYLKHGGLLKLSTDEFETILKLV